MFLIGASSNDAIALATINTLFIGASTLTLEKLFFLKVSAPESFVPDFSSITKEVLLGSFLASINIVTSSYYIVVVFIDPLQGLYAILFVDTVDWFTPPTTRWF